ncbi:hypothetical protein BCR44DRAFT_1225389 [Catenaria anguillulae PL171]|uniref:Uncharacterized protein n=1 Tax=Catenaria anguillulae PL171 TaxID=765915 RepID=A0A1Y2HE56_9FUNG|nr:hypothetical protein BCR44DRAFT_1225389 [Catenaria anguillulae PL171]
MSRNHQRTKRTMQQPILSNNINRKNKQPALTKTTITDENAAHVGEVQDDFGDECHGADSAGQGQEPETESVGLGPELPQTTDSDAVDPNPETHELAAPKPTSIDAHAEQLQPSVHQHLTSEELLDWVEDDIVDESQPSTETSVALNVDNSPAPSAASFVVHAPSSSSHTTASTAIPPSPAPTVDPLVPAPGSAPASRPSSPAADPAAGMIGDPLVAGETAPAAAATNGSAKRSLEMVDTDDFDPCNEPETSTSYKRLRTSDEHNK